MTGRAFVFGDNVDTDLLAPGRYMAAPIEVLASHCLENLDPGFAGSVRPGDVVVAGWNFGMGSSREQAAQALRHLGIAAVVAKSFAGIFYRNAINLGLPAFVLAGDHRIRTGDPVSLDIRRARLGVGPDAAAVNLEPLPDFLLALIEDGGLVPHLQKRFGAKEPT